MFHNHAASLPVPCPRDHCTYEIKFQYLEDGQGFMEMHPLIECGLADENPLCKSCLSSFWEKHFIPFRAQQMQALSIPLPHPSEDKDSPSDK